MFTLDIDYEETKPSVTISIKTEQDNPPPQPQFIPYLFAPLHCQANGLKFPVIKIEVLSMLTIKC